MTWEIKASVDSPIWMLKISWSLTPDEELQKEGEFNFLKDENL